MLEQPKSRWFEENRTLNGKEPSYQNPVIPQGFRIKQTEASWRYKGGQVIGWNDGLVIEDKNGNEFVWVPVKDGIGKNEKKEREKVTYEKWVLDCYEESISLKDVEDLKQQADIKEGRMMLSDIIEDSLPDLAEDAQVEKYGGFYIARYEAGIEEKDLKRLYHLEEGYEFICVDERNNTGEMKPISKKNSQVWNFIEYENAKTAAESMYQKENLRSGLMTGKQFDTIIAWAIQQGYSLENAHLWGNFLNTTKVEYTLGYASYLRKHSQDWKIKDYGVKERENIIFTRTGGVENAKMNNIYDIAGNVFEFTTDRYQDKIAMVRGGSAAYASNSHHPVYRI